MFQDNFDRSVLQWNYQGLKEVRLDLLREKDLKYIRFLFLKRNRLTALPREIGKLISLTQLHVQSNNLKSLPDSIGELKCLEVLDVEGNCLIELPSSIGKLCLLRKLQVSNNSLRKLPAEIGKLDLLLTLEASNNSLCYIPLELSDCRRLKVISFDRNKLTWFPRQLCNLHFLEELSVYGNFLEFIPQSVYQLYSLQYIFANSNPNLTAVPYEARSIFTDCDSCGLSPTEKKTPGHVIYAKKHKDLEPTRVILPLEIEEVLEPDKNCVPSLQEMSLRRVGRLLYTWPDLIEDDILPKKLERLLRDSTGICLYCRDNIYISAFPVVREGMVMPQRDVGLYLALCCSWNCLNNLPQNEEFPMLFPYKEDTLNQNLLFG